MLSLFGFSIQEILISQTRFSFYFNFLSLYTTGIIIPLKFETLTEPIFF